MLILVAYGISLSGMHHKVAMIKFNIYYRAVYICICMQRGLATRKLYVCPSVQRVICDKT